MNVKRGELGISEEHDINGTKQSTRTGVEPASQGNQGLFAQSKHN